ncbi:MAG: GNAT family N-acetyltransferase [Christensenellaceae bacterium]|nr:GNAT family N-acetyltransferase [Christensenellaceae bacterium]
MKIETERLTLRPFETADAPALQAILGDAETMAFMEPPYDLARTEAFLRDFCIGRQGAVAAALRETGQVIGYLLFNPLEAGIYELGWIINRGCWRQGYAYEAVSALIRYAFEELGAHKLMAETIDPVRSAGLMRKLGMRLEGVQRQQVRDQEGRWQDMQLYGLLRSEYKQ